MVYSGTGGLPPSARKRGDGGGGGGGGGGAARKPFGFGLYEDLPSGKKAKIWPLRLNPGEKNVSVLWLDEAKYDPDPRKLASPNIEVHDGFKFNNGFGNILVCAGFRPEGCPMDVALQRKHQHAHWCKETCTREGKTENTRGAWRWVGTIIKFQPYTFQKGPMQGVTLPFQRQMVFVPDAKDESKSVYATLCAYREQFGGLRGRVFSVRRPDDKFSAKCGTIWTPINQMTDEQMMEKFEEAAQIYGLPVEQFIRPYNYEKVLAPLSPEEMLRAAKWVAAEYNVSLDGSAPARGELPTEPADAAGAADSPEESIGAVVGDDEDNEIPF